MQVSVELVDVGKSSQRQSRKSCKRICCQVLWAIIGIILVIILAAFLYGWLSDFGQCNRSCQMNTCDGKNSSCYTTRTNGKRIGVRNKCKCNSAEIPRTLSIADTIKIDKELTEYCECKNGECKTVDYEPEK